MPEILRLRIDRTVRTCEAIGVTQAPDVTDVQLAGAPPKGGAPIICGGVPKIEARSTNH